MLKSHPFAVAIVLIAVIAAASVVAVRKGPDVIAGWRGDAAATSTSPVIRPISSADHILGNPAAPVIFLEYGDFECPFCQEYHPRIMFVAEEMGESGQVAIAYRHFPNAEKHPRARPAAIASECVAAQLGDEGFFAYAQGLYANAPASLADDALLAAAVSLGAEEAAFLECLAGSAAARRVDADYREGLALAKNDADFGTPYTVALAADGRQVPFAGSQTREFLLTLAGVLLGPAESDE